MKSILFVSLLLVMAFAVYADSDAIGIIAGTQEPLTLALYNSSGQPDTAGSCSIKILSDTSVLISTTSMINSGGGIYSYTWDVPQESGNYRILMNCTTSDSINQSVGGELYVSPHSFQKTVAQGVVKYGPQYTGTYAPNWWDSNNNKIAAVALCILVIGIAMYMYDNYGAKIGR